MSLLLAALLSGGGPLSPDEVEADAFGGEPQPPGDAADEGAALVEASAETDRSAPPALVSAWLSPEPVVIRPYTVWDWPGVAALHRTAGDMPDDLRRISEAYGSDPRDGFWVAQRHGHTVGAIGLTHAAPHVAEVRRLCVRAPFDAEAIAAMLLRTALRHASDAGDLKVLLAGQVPDAAFEAVLGSEGYMLSRTREQGGEPVRELYRNIYFTPEPFAA